MTSRTALLTGALLLAACGGASDPAEERRDNAPPGETAADPGTVAPPPLPPSDPAAPKWDLLASGEGTALRFPAKGAHAVLLFCPEGERRILLNVPAFRPIGSEERLSFGSGGAAHALVADTKGDRQRGGVSGTGALPGNLGALISGPVSASYGAQVSGPHPAPPRALARAFLAGCGFPPPPSPPPAPTGTTSGSQVKVGACLMQDGKRLTNPPLRAVGTEPFWAAEIEGRCVTYSHPENQQGTRVWTQYTPRSDGGGSWTGALNGRPFTLTTRPEPRCSDGMSDRRYPIAVELTVGGEQRQGCAEPG